MKTTRNMLTAAIAALVTLAVLFAVAPNANAAAAGLSIGPVTASTNTSATASTGTNYVIAGNGQIDTLYITKSATNSTVVWITTDQGVTVYSNTLVNVTSALTRPRLLPTDLGGTAWGATNIAPVPLSFSGNLYLNAYSAVGTSSTVSATFLIQR